MLGKTTALELNSRRSVYNSFLGGCPPEKVFIEQHGEDFNFEVAVIPILEKCFKRSVHKALNIRERERKNEEEKEKRGCREKLLIFCV